MKTSVRPPLIPNEGEQESLEEGFFTSIGKLVGGAKSSISEIFGSVFPGFRKKPKNNQHQNYYHYQQQQWRPNSWPMQESFEIPDNDEPPPPVETRTSTPKKTYAFMSKDTEKTHHLRQGRAYFNGWDREQQQQQPQQQHMHQHQHRQHSLGPQTYYEQSCENTNEIVFGAVQELDSKRRSVEIKAVNYGEPIYDQYGLRSRMHYNGYSNGL